jgi:uncharacterized peroxidase-related enzyme
LIGVTCAATGWRRTPRPDGCGAGVLGEREGRVISWIDVITYSDSAGRLRKLYDRIKGPNDNVDNIMLAHSLRPHTMEGHMALYKNTLHHSSNTVPVWFLEVMGIYTSLLNSCAYCVEHHFAGLKRLLEDDARAAAMRGALTSDNPTGVFSPKESAALTYVRRLTETPASVSEDDVSALRAAGWNDGEILEINQTAAYFSYANRTVLGLGINTDSDVLGLSPDGGEDDAWRHR